VYNRVSDIARVFGYRIEGITIGRDGASSFIERVQRTEGDVRQYDDGKSYRDICRLVF
jgi:hypothetical protein